MALIKCSNCGKDISDKAKKCIHCKTLVKSISCPRCNEKIDLDKNKCPKCKKILRNKIPVLGKIWIMANAPGLLFLSLLFFMNIGYSSTVIYLLIGLLLIGACVMNCLLFSRINPVYFYISSGINYLNFILFLADKNCEQFIAIILLIYAVFYSIITYLFIRKCIKYKKISLISLIGINTVFILYMVIAYLNPNKTIDYIEKYNDYLKYAFGEDYTVEKETYKELKNFWFNEYYYWTITYKDENNITKEQYLYNYELLDYEDQNKASDYSFARIILDDYLVILEDKLEIGNVSNLDEHIYIHSLYNTYDDNYEDYLYHKDILKLIEPGTGLNFKNININSLDNNLYYLGMSVFYIPPASNIEEYTKNQVNKLINHYNIKNAFISCGISYTDYSETSPTYCVKQGQEISCPDSKDNQDSLFINKSNYIILN